MTARDVASHRLSNQQIAQSRCKSPAEVVEWLGAIQAQDFAGALWSIGLRSPYSSVADVEKAIADRAILRTWPMRGTLHFVAAADAGWMLELLAPRVIASRESRHKEVGLDAAVFLRCEKIIVKSLQGGRQVTRDVLLDMVEKAGISIEGYRGYVILWRLAHERVICFGLHEGKQPTFALLDEWVAKPKKLSREPALAELARRYFTSHGPATLHDFAWWTGLKMTEAREAADLASSKLAREKIGGADYWMARDSAPVVRQISPVANLLPGFDEFMLGYTDRSAALDPKHAAKILPGNNGVFKPTLVIDGRVAGIWKREIKKKSVVVAASPFAKLKRAESEALAVPLARLGQFHGLPSVFSIEAA